MSMSDKVYHTNRQFIKDVARLQEQAAAACDSVYQTFGSGPGHMDHSYPAVATILRQIEEFESCWGPEIEKAVKCEELRKECAELMNENTLLKHKLEVAEHNVDRLNAQRHELMSSLKLLQDRVDLLGGDD